MQCQAISQKGHMTYIYYYTVQNELILKYSLVQMIHHWKNKHIALINLIIVSDQ